MNPRSNIGASLNKKRHISHMKKFGAYFVFILFFISLGILGLTNEKVRIKEVKVSGNSSVTSEDIIQLVEKEMNRNYAWIIATDNILLLRRGEIRNDILNSFRKIGTASVVMSGIDKIEIVVTERESKNLWCKGTPLMTQNCYFMDSSGFIFEEAPVFSKNIFPKYFGLINDENPIGQYYFKNNFAQISGLYNAFDMMSFEPVCFNALSEHEYEFDIIGGGKVFLNDKKTFESSLTNLQALVDNKYIKTDVASLKKIKYIDLRFGNKVNFELNK